METFEKWIRIRITPEYGDNVDYDYKTIDLSMIENVIPRL